MKRHFGLTFLLLASGMAPAVAQGFSMPQQQPGGFPAPGGYGAPVQSGPGPTNQPPPFQPSNSGQPTNGDFAAPPSGSRVGPGFGVTRPPAPSPGQQAERQNYADELTDFHVPPQSTLQINVASETPLTIPGGHLITTAEVKQTEGMQVLVVDVLVGPPHPTIPGARTWPGAGNPGTFDDAIQQNLWNALSQATQNNPNYPIVFLCAGARCWESYNASLRAANMGFKTVLWYRGGLASWQAAGLPMTGDGQQPQAAARPAPKIGFGK